MEHTYTNNIICPYCGYEDINSWEQGSGVENIGLTECKNCEKPFYATRHITIEYSTEKARYGTCLHCKKVDVVLEDHCSTIGSYKNLCLECGNKELRRLQMEYIKNL